ncbi:hypothetical protein JHK82_035931 [Glycine max]|uniref:Uncharacterized protein n=2 Tax=Glycine subgen. Soja TaxID=1462606 RepID=K7LZ18_SOYBN|nr:hypothetical protein JHK87_035857 [Glycine soja]KAG4970240.1 hypothetical protein JHK85_036661 [Glycine max]KAG4976646.1 hypothetical protein JHK86_036120 [Glycine max]KAG5112662.1 hypothetical protein JHK82_035931 [Glycine max]KAG5129940.1 hypothetical protein JHK84_036337 [Glycine max]
MAVRPQNILPRCPDGVVVLLFLYFLQDPVELLTMLQEYVFSKHEYSFNMTRLYSILNKRKKKEKYMKR